MENNRLHLTAQDHGNPQIQVKGAVMEPQWSPDGTKVLFSVITSGASQNASNSSDASNASNAASASSSAASATQEQFVHDDDAVAT